MTNIALADDLATEICKALDIEVGTIARMLIDLEAGQPVKVYLSAYADKAIEGIDWARHLTGAEVKKPARQDVKWIQETRNWPRKAAIR